MVLPHYMGRSKEVDIEGKKGEENQDDIIRQNSLSSLSPLEDIPLLLPQEPDAQVAHSIDQKLAVKHDNQIDQPNGIYKSFSSSKSKSDHVDPDMPMPDFADELDSADLQNKVHIPDKWSETSEEDDRDVYISEHGQSGPRIACHCQVRITCALEVD